MRDRLPDLLHERLPAGSLADVRAHVQACPECREELALLTRIRAASGAPKVDAARIAAALPTYRPAPMWRRAVRSSQLLRAAAAAVVLFIGYQAFWGSARLDPMRAFEPTADRTVDRTADRTADRTVDAPVQELAIGDTFLDLTDNDLIAVLDAIGTLEAVTPDAAEEVVVPVVGRGGP